MKISEVEREQYLSDMKSLIADHRKQKKKFPRDPEFAKLCGISIHSVKNYRKLISQRNKKALDDRFAIEKIQSIEDSLDTFSNHIEWYDTIRKDDNQDIDIRMNAAKLIEEAQKHITEVMVDSLTILDDDEIDEGNSNDNSKNNSNDNSKNNSNDNVLFNKEHLHRTEEKITEGIKSITD